MYKRSELGPNSGIILDFDGTMLPQSAFYQNQFREALENAVMLEHGEVGRDYLAWHRKTTGHLGILSLPFFGLDYQKLLDELMKCSLEFVPQVNWYACLEQIEAPKIIFTGSPVSFVLRVLSYWKVDVNCFRAIIGWEPGEGVPLKFAASPKVFQAILDRYDLRAESSWSIGDSWCTDLAPAHKTGMRTIAIGSTAGAPDFRFSTLADALSWLTCTESPAH